MMKFLVILFTLVMTSGANSVHQDRILDLDEDGNIIGLPEEYCPAKFDLNKNYLRIKDKEIRFPNCINYYFTIHNKPKLDLRASWYHSKDIMPYYLTFNISQKNKDYGYTVLLDLETLELIDVEVEINKVNSTYNHKIDIEESCISKYESEIKSLTN